jgi:hypothetical protein
VRHSIHFAATALETTIVPIWAGWRAEPLKLKVCNDESISTAHSMALVGAWLSRAEQIAI